MKSALQPYFGKRDFKITSEPEGGKSSKGALTFVVQKHAASRLHYDFRLELDGTLKSWAVPKGPSLDPADKRMAVHVEDHPIDYGGFEGTIPKGQYGAGQVIVWDNGTWEPVGDAAAGYAAGKLKFRLDGKKLQGGWTLVRMHGRAGERQEPWLLIKERDDDARPSADYSVVDAEPKSVLSDRTIVDKPASSSKEAASDDSQPRKTSKRSATAKSAPSATAAKTAAKRTSRASAADTPSAAPIPLSAGAVKASLPAMRDDIDASAFGREQQVAPAIAGDAGAASASAARPATARKTAAKKTATARAVAPAAAAAARRSANTDGDATVEGIRISHPDRVIDSSSGITKIDVVNYYLDVSRLILPHLVKRPVSLVRAPAGLSGHLVFQRHAGTLRMAELRELDPAFAPDHEPMVEVDSFTALIGAAQANVIEFHTWNATSDDPHRPDRIVFDLDPGEGVPWRKMQEGAELMRSLLEHVGLASFLKTSGGKGLHVVVPIAPKEDWETVRALAKRIVEHMAETIPDRFVAKSGPKNRVGKVFIDYLRNGFGATTACAWSARARPGLGVSVTCSWDELGAITAGDHWTIRNVHDRIEERGDPWRDHAKTRQTLVKAMKAIDGARAAA